MKQFHGIAIIRMNRGDGLINIFAQNAVLILDLPLEAVPGIRTIAAGTFDEQSWLNSDKYTQRHVFTRSAQHWSDIPEGVESYKEHFR